jgi:glyoxylase-like metal-dependent hydrolase (beta-lactamase superfamily II)
MKFGIIPVTAYQQNCSLVWDENTMEAAVIDPGGDIARIEAALAKTKTKLVKILCTHGHLDHVGAVQDVADRFGVPIEGPHIEDKFWIDDLPRWCEMAGFPPSRAFTPNRWLNDGDTVSVGSETFQVIHCPGHTPGHVVFFHKGARLAIVGDVLFQGSIGRTDFPKGDYDTLISSIRNKLWPLGDDVQFVPGHGPMSTFGDERATNPFVADKRYG